MSHLELEIIGVETVLSVNFTQLKSKYEASINADHNVCADWWEFISSHFKSNV